jgi:hypothetical protein
MNDMKDLTADQLEIYNKLDKTHYTQWPEPLFKVTEYIASNTTPYADVACLYGHMALYVRLGEKGYSDKYKEILESYGKVGASRRIATEAEGDGYLEYYGES